MQTEKKSDRIMTMRLITPSKTFSIVSAYAPQQGCEEDEKQRFWNELENVTVQIPDTDELIVAGDLNGHVGEEREAYARWHGGKTLGRRNNEGGKILDFARSNDLAVTNTFFTKREEQTYTYQSGVNRTVIDYIMVRRENLGKVKDCKVIPGEPVAPQHRLLVVDLMTKKMRKNRRERPTTINWWKLKEKEGEELERKTAEILVEQGEVGDLTWKETYPKIIKAAKDILGESKAGKYLEKESWWWNDEVQNAIAKKKEAFKRWKQSGMEIDRENYRALNKFSKEKCAIAKEKGYEDIYRDLEQNGPKKIYKLARGRHRRSKDIDRMTFVRNEEGKILGDDKSIKDRWKSYFAQLLNTKNYTVPLPEVQATQGPIDSILESEVKI
jgi:hypothetical protein